MQFVHYFHRSAAYVDMKGISDAYSVDQQIHFALVVTPTIIGAAILSMIGRFGEKVSTCLFLLL